MLFAAWIPFQDCDENRERRSLSLMVVINGLIPNIYVTSTAKSQRDRREICPKRTKIIEVPMI